MRTTAIALVSCLSILPATDRAEPKGPPEGGHEAGASAAVQAHPAAAAAPAIRAETFTLPNGLEVIVSEDHRLPLVAVNLWYHVGPANEVAGRTGFAHLFEHMMFQASKHVPPDGHFRLLESAGASDINGSTNYDRTNYFETLPSNQLELGLWLESDRMGYLLDRLDQTALSNQQDVVRNERRQGVENQPYGLAEEALYQQLFPPPHPYHGYVIGSHADLQAARLQDVKDFFKQYYPPNNASLAVVGDVDPAAVRRLVEKYFGTLKRGPDVPKIAVTTPPVTAERRRVVKDRIELPRVYLAWITSPIFKPGDAEAQIAARALGGGKSSRLYKKLVYELQIAQDVTAQQDSLLLGSAFIIQATARPGHTAEEIERVLDAELERFRREGPDAGEVERARNGIETDIVQRLENFGGDGGMADRLNHYNHFLGTPGYLDRDLARYRAVTPAAVRTFANERLGRSARAVVHAVPGEPDLGQPVPTPPPAASAPGTGAEATNADEPWRNQPPKPGPSRPLQLPTPQSTTLPTGLTVILNERPGLPIVAANLVVRTGSGANPLDQPGLANFTVAMLDEGTSTKTALQLADEAAQIGTAIGTSSTMDASFVTVRALRPHLPAALDLLADVVRRPSFPPEEIERQRSSRLAALVQQRNDPSSVANRVMFAALYGPRHPYGFTETGTEAAVKAIDRAGMETFWKQHFVSNNAALVVAGAIGLTELTALAEKAFGGWATGTPARPALEEPAPAAARVIVVDRPGAPQTEVRVITIGAPRSSPDYTALRVMNATLGGLFSSRINMNLREAKGFTYGAGSQFVFRRAAGPFLAFSAVRTDATAPAVSEIVKEIRRMSEAPVTPDELASAKDALVRSLPGDFESSASAATTFSNLFVYDLPLDYFAQFPSRVSAVTAGAGQALAKKYLDPAKLVVVAVGDRAKIQADLEKLGLGPVELRDVEANVVPKTDGR